MNLRIEGLSKKYPNGVQALRDVSLAIPPGLFGLLGPNGAGKSTLMRTLATLQDADSGAAFLGELDVLRKHRRRGRVRGPFWATSMMNWSSSARNLCASAKYFSARALPLASPPMRGPPANRTAKCGLMTRPAQLEGAAEPDRDEAWLADLDRRHATEAASLSSETELAAVQRRRRAALPSRGP